MFKLRGANRLFRSNSKAGIVTGGANNAGSGRGGNVIEWEVRPGGMLVQKRENGGDGTKEVIHVRVTTGSKWHDISLFVPLPLLWLVPLPNLPSPQPTERLYVWGPFGELKVLVSLVTGLEPREQRLLFRGKEREDSDHLHMVGVKDADKVLLLEDPAIKERKLRALRNQVLGTTPCHTIKV